MWELKEPKPVKLLIGILAADKTCLDIAIEELIVTFGKADFVSDVWPFNQTTYYNSQIGEKILRQFICIHCLIDPEKLAEIKLKTNKLEQDLALQIDIDTPRPINLDPGIIEPSKLILASTKNFSHRIYIGKKIYAETTLIFDKGSWNSLPYTFPDYKQDCYHKFFNKVREKLLEQLKSKS